MTSSPRQPQVAAAMHDRPAQERPAQERTVAEAWPSISASPLGRRLGRLFSNRAGVRLAGVPLTLGWLLAVALAPLAGLLYLVQKAPRWPLVFFGAVNPAAVRYRLTTVRLLVEHPNERRRAPVASLPIGGFGAVEIDERPGQGWYHAADVVFRSSGAEVLRLAAVPRPEPFVRTILKTQQAMAPAVAGPAGASV